MPTVVHFVGAEAPVTLEDDYDRVNLQLRTEGKAGEFVRVIGENRDRLPVREGRTNRRARRTNGRAPAATGRRGRTEVPRRLSFQYDARP
jgi:hypothetical protein